MNPGNNYTPISTATTTVVGGSLALGGIRRVNVMGIFINKTLTGTVTLRTGVTQIAQFAIGTVPGSYWLSDNGTEVADFQVVTSATDDVTVCWNNL